MNYTHIPIVSCQFSDQPGNVLANDILAASEAHFEYEMILVTEGRARVVINHKTYSLARKSLLFISRLERHNFMVLDEPYSRYVVTMSSELIMSNIKDIELTSIFIQRPKEFQHAVTLSDQAFDMLLPLFIRMKNEYENQPAFYISRSASLVVAILIDLYRTHPECFPSRSHNNISNAVLNTQRYINDHFNQKLTLQEIADQNYISRHALSLAFKDIVGISFKDYLLIFRITEAKKLLITTDLSVEEIASQVGYINVNNFIQIFKEKESITPLQYRKQFTFSTVQ